MIGNTLSHYRIIEKGGHMQTLSRQSGWRFLWLVADSWWWQLPPAPQCNRRHHRSGWR